jgi:type I restriction-modification system DNA methylase subunit
VDQKTAVKLIRDTFEQSFDEERYVLFIKNLLNTLDESAPFSYQGNLIPDAYKQHITALKRIGKYKDADNSIDILIVHLKKDNSLDRARTMQRNFIAWYLNGSRGGELKDAALVAFISPDDEDWRFSLVKMDYTLEETPQGKIKVKKELTPARRWSFLVGSHESSHTAQDQLVSILQSDRQPLLSDLEDAFNIESVTKEFFIKYRDLFNDVKDALDQLVSENNAIKHDFDSNNIITVDFAKKLLGQIVFLYFLQKKGWFGVERDLPWGTGHRDFLRRLFDKKAADYSNYFNDILEPLFYNTLALERTDDFSDRFNCKIPFLNGGLFDPIGGYNWVHVDILLPDILFSNSIKTKEGDTGTGILDVFDRYNFTVKEDEPLEKEVAIDPEMLGKVFENLLEVKDRKSKGTYYTPREIVHYMCQESLVNYLDTTLNHAGIPLVKEQPPQGRLVGDTPPEQGTLKVPGQHEIVQRVEIEDFVRHGEAAVEHDTRVVRKGKETRDYSYRIPVGVRNYAELLDGKLDEIRICDPAVGSGAFLVGMMTEIVRLRSILSTYIADKKGRSPYQFKRHAIQSSLYGVDIDQGAVEIAKLRLWLSLIVDEDDISQIQPLPNLDYKIVCGNSLLRCEQDILYWPLYEELEKLKISYFDEVSRNRKNRLRDEIDALLAKIDNSHEFNFTVNFSEVFPRKENEKRGFDAVIANPPYIRHEKLKELKAELSKYFTCYNGTADIYVYFFERGQQILKGNGSLAYISSNKYFRAAYGDKLRRFLGINCQICQIIDFGDAPVFEAIAYPSIIVLKNTLPQENNVRVFNWTPGPALENFATTVRAGSSILPQYELTPASWNLQSSSSLRLLEKLEEIGKPLGEYIDGRFYRGIVTGLNEAFVIDRKTRDRLIKEDRTSENLIKPFMRGRDIKRWTIEFAEQYLLFIPWHFPLHNDKSVVGASNRAESEFSHKYPAIYNHLLSFRKQLEGRNKDETGIRYEWYALQRCAATYEREFQEPKIVYPNICKRNEFAWDDKGYYYNQKAFIIPEASKYLLGVLNSTVVSWLFGKLLAKLQNGYYEPSSIFMKDFPIPISDNPQPIEILVDKILKLTNDKGYKTNSGKQAAVKEYECQIDLLVYDLYGLTSAEIAIIEAGCKD